MLDSIAFRVLPQVSSLELNVVLECLRMMLESLRLIKGSVTALMLLKGEPNLIGNFK